MPSKLSLPVLRLLWVWSLAVKPPGAAVIQNTAFKGEVRGGVSFKKCLPLASPTILRLQPLLHSFRRRNLEWPSRQFLKPRLSGLKSQLGQFFTCDPRQVNVNGGTLSASWCPLHEMGKVCVPNWWEFSRIKWGRFIPKTLRMVPGMLWVPRKCEVSLFCVQAEHKSSVSNTSQGMAIHLSRGHRLGFLSSISTCKTTNLPRFVRYFCAKRNAVW